MNHIKNIGSLLIVFVFLFFSGSAHAQVTAGSAMEFYGKDPLGNSGMISIQRVGKSTNIGSGPFTIEWFMKSIPEKNQTGTCISGGSNWIKGNIILDAQMSGTVDRGGFGVSLAGNVLAFGVETALQNNTICGTKTINDGAWHHVAVTRLSTTGLMSIFIDGNLDYQFFGPSGDISYNETRSSNSPLDSYIVIGSKKPDPAIQYEPFSGAIDELRISTMKRYDYTYTTPTAPFSSDATTAALFHFNECDQTTVGDSSSNNIQASVVSIPNPLSPIRIGSSAPLTEGIGGLSCVSPTPPVCTTKIKGDGNCDGMTNLSDFEIWRKEYSGESSTIEADFNGNSTTDLSDFEIWRKGFTGEI